MLKLFAVFKQKRITTPNSVRLSFSTATGMHPIYNQARHVPDPRGPRFPPWYLIASTTGDEIIAALPNFGLTADEINAAGHKTRYSAWANKVINTCHGRWVVPDFDSTPNTGATNRPATLYGVVTDQITSVTVSGGTASPDAAPIVHAVVKNNVWAARAPYGFAKLTYKSGARTYETIHPTELNRDPTPKRCARSAGSTPTGR